MFILRQFTKTKCTQKNICIGSEYSVVFKETDKEEFIRTHKILMGENEDINSEIFSFIVYNCGSEIYPLYKGHYYWMMTDSGKTFTNLTYK